MFGEWVAAGAAILSLIGVIINVVCTLKGNRTQEQMAPISRHEPCGLSGLGIQAPKTSRRHRLPFQDTGQGTRRLQTNTTDCQLIAATPKPPYPVGRFSFQCPTGSCR